MGGWVGGSNGNKANLSPARAGTGLSLAKNGKNGKNGKKMEKKWKKMEKNASKVGCWVPLWPKYEKL